MNLQNTLMHANFLRQKPLVSLKIANGYLKAMILKQPVLRTIDFAVTNVCNSRCKMCSAWLLYKRDREQGKQVLSPDEIVDAFLQGSRLGAMHINLTGGEPLTRDIDELCYIIKNIKPKYHLISMVTNSLLATRENFAKLKNAGLDTVQLSIESMDPAIHDDLRGVPGNHAKVMQAFQYAKDLGLMICLSAVLTHTNFKEAERIIDFANKNNNHDVFVLLNPISASGAMVGQTQSKLTEGDLERYRDLLKIGNVRADTIINFSGKEECPGGKERIHITAFGDVITCPHVQVSYGNVRKEPLKTIWQRMYNFKYLREHSPVCKHAFKQEYYDKFLKPIEHLEDMPIPVLEHPELKDEFAATVKNLE